MKIYSVQFTTYSNKEYELKHNQIKSIRELITYHSVLKHFDNISLARLFMSRCISEVNVNNESMILSIYSVDNGKEENETV